jgi:hypothetical protein
MLPVADEPLYARKPQIAWNRMSCRVVFERTHLNDGSGSGWCGLQFWNGFKRYPAGIELVSGGAAMEWATASGRPLART